MSPTVMDAVHKPGGCFSGCAKCEIRTCTIGKNLTSCAFCTNYGCDKLLKHFETDPTARTRLEAMKRPS